MFTQYNMTYISRNNMRILLSKDITSREIIEFLNEGAVFRQFRDLLSEMIDSPNLSKSLTEIILKDSEKSYETVRKDVRNWLNGRHTPNREDIFYLCFSLHLSLIQTDKLLLSISETGIHYRNPQELVYAFGLKNHLSWKEVTALKQRLMPVYESSLSAWESAQNVSRENNSTEQSFRGRNSTEQVFFERRDILTKEFELLYLNQVQNEQDLEAFIREQAPFMGSIHLTIYHDFKGMMNLLQRPGSNEKKLSVSEVAEQYLHPAAAASSGRNYSYLQKVIRKNWPTKDNIYKMMNQSRNISRKMMILLFLITEEFQNNVNSCLNQDFLNPEAADEDFDLLYLEEELEEDEILEMRIKLINMYLNHYSMNALNPGNPFDCLVLYALKASYMNEETMSDKMNEVLSCLFQDEETE